MLDAWVELEAADELVEEIGDAVVRAVVSELPVDEFAVVDDEVAPVIGSVVSKRGSIPMLIEPSTG